MKLPLQRCALLLQLGRVEGIAQVCCELGCPGVRTHGHASAGADADGDTSLSSPVHKPNSETLQTHGSDSQDAGLEPESAAQDQAADCTAESSAEATDQPAQLPPTQLHSSSAAAGIGVKNIKKRAAAAPADFSCTTPDDVAYSGDSIGVVGMLDMLQHAHDSGDFSPVVRFVGKHFSDVSFMCHSFVKQSEVGSAAGAASPMAPSQSDSGVDLSGAAQCLANMVGCPSDAVRNSLLFASKSLWSSLQLRGGASVPSAVWLRPLLLTCLNPAIEDPDYHDEVLVPLWQFALGLPKQASSMLQCWFSHFTGAVFERVLASTQQFITLKIISGEARVDNMKAPMRWMQLLHAANEQAAQRAKADKHSAAIAGRSAARAVEHSGEGDGRMVPYTAFYNDVVSGEISLRNEFHRWIEARESGIGGTFSFCMFPFVLDANAKANVLKLDSAMQQQLEARQSIMAGMFGGGAVSPYLIMEVHRDNLIEDVMNHINATSSSNALKKPLKVKFHGEQGVDEGGVRKEMFQLLSAQLFTPDYGMFVEESDTHLLWFNASALEANIQFELLGSLVGLAIYNDVILNVAFPLSVYRKLAGVEMTLADLAEIRPAVAKGLQDVLEYDGGDDEEVFCLTFTAPVEEWGVTKSVPLLPGGEEQSVTAANKAEYVSLYVQFAMERSIQAQFDSFKRGFYKVTQGPTIQMFQPEELKLLVNGSESFDFHELQKGSRYEEPYSEEHQVIQWLWEALHDLGVEDQKRFLKFATGSDRAPIKGLRDVRLVVSRAGPDSELLPTAHTCFSHVLLNEYSSKEKLVAKLAVAIKESEGFGLI